MIIIQVLFLFLTYIFFYIRKWKHLEKKEFLIKSAFFAYMAALVTATILPIDLTLDPKWLYPKESGFSYGNLIPFRNIMGGHYVLIRDVVLNVIMTIPYGVLLHFVCKKPSLIRSFFYSLWLSLSIELVQLLMTIFLLNYRRFDVTDIITNVLGACIGYLAYIIFAKLFGGTIGFKFK